MALGRKSSAAAGSAYDVVITGASLDAVVLACGLAQAGRTVALFDQHTHLGGPHRPCPVNPGRGGPSAGLAPLGPRGIHPAVARALRLEAQGLVMVPAAPPALLSQTGPGLTLSRSGRETAARLDGLKAGESARFHHVRTLMTRTRALVAPFLVEPPLDPAAMRGRSARSFREKLGAAARLGDDALFDLLNLAGASCADRLRSDLQAPAFRTLLSALALAHQNAGPMAPGSALGLLNLPMLDGAGPEAGQGNLWYGTQIFGGAVALSAALEKALHAAGVDLFLETDVSEILVNDGKVEGVSLWDGRQVPAQVVVSGHDMKRTLLDLISLKALPKDLLKTVSRAEAMGRVARLAVTVGSLEFLPAAWRSDFPSQVCIVDGLAAMEAAGDDAREGRLPTAPWLSVSLESAGGAGLDEGSDAVTGRAVLMVSAHLAPDQFHDGAWTDARRDAFRDVVLERMGSVWPRFGSAVEGVALWLPSDLESQTQRTGGEILAGDWAPDRLYWNRPVPMLARHLSAIEGLVLCGPDMAVLPNEPGVAGLALSARLAEGLSSNMRIRQVP